MEKSKKINIFKIIFIILVILVLGFGAFCLWYYNSVTYEMNEKITIKDDNITLVVKSVDTYTIENENAALDLPSLIDGDYFKVEVEITNNGDETYRGEITYFSLEDENGNGSVPSLVLSENNVDDILPEEIEPNQTVSGYLYFPRNLSDNRYLDNAYSLQYRDFLNSGDIEVYIVKLS